MSGITMSETTTMSPAAPTIDLADPNAISTAIAKLDAQVTPAAMDGEVILRWDDRKTILAFADKEFQSASVFADSVLAKVKVDQLGPLGEPMAKMRVTIGQLDPKKLLETVDPAKVKALEARAGGQGWLGRLFKDAAKEAKALKDMAKTEIELFKNSFGSAKDQVDGIVTRLQDRKADAMAQIAILDRLYDEAEQLVRNLTPLIALAKQVKLSWETTLMAQLQAEVDAALDDEKNLKAAKVQDLRGAIELLGQKIDSLEKSRFIMVLQGPGIRQIQQNAYQAAEQITMTIGQAVPVWKMSMVQALGQVSMMQAAESVALMRGLTESMIQNQAAMVGKGVEISERNAAEGIVGGKALLDAMATMRTALERADKAAEHASKVRAEASKQMADAEKEYVAYVNRRGAAASATTGAGA